MVNVMPMPMPMPMYHERLTAIALKQASHWHDKRSAPWHANNEARTRDSVGGKRGDVHQVK